MKPRQVGKALLLGIAFYIMGLLTVWSVAFSPSPLNALSHYVSNAHVIPAILMLNLRSWWGLVGIGATLLASVAGKPKLSMAVALTAGVVSGFVDKLILMAVVSEL